MKTHDRSIVAIPRSLALTAITLVVATVALPARAQTETLALLPSLTTYASILPQAAGEFYGVDNDGGLAHCDLGCGTVFDLVPEAGGTWRKNILHTFTGTDGVWPFSGLIRDSAGNLYGTTYYGGTTYGSACGSNGCGVIYRLSPVAQAWELTVLHSFTGGEDGSNPTALAFGPSGNLVGISRGGGSAGYGVVFQLALNSSGAWQETRLFNFPGGYAGQQPVGLLLDAAGNIFGAAGGGNKNCYSGYCGLVFKLSQSSLGWKESVIYRFHGSDGSLPNPSLIFDSSGRMYGSTLEGGKGCSIVDGCGIVFQLSQSDGAWNETVIHSFTDQGDGYAPVDGLAFDAQGNLYGGTQFGNDVLNCNPFEIGACGQIFKLTPHSGVWGITAEYATPGFITPVGNLVIDASGTVYASASDQVYFEGGAVFEIFQ